MAFSVSPAIDVNEKDFGGIVSAISTSIGATVGYSADGLPNQRVFLSSKDNYINEFGKPDGIHYLGYTSLNFLDQGNSLWIVRATNGARSSGIMVEDSTAYGEASPALTCGSSTEKIEDYAEPTFLSSELFILYNLRPGVNGNNLRLGIVTCADTTDSTSAMDLEVLPSDENEFIILLYNYNSTTLSYELLEQHLVTRVPSTKSLSLRSIFITDVINNQSDYLYCFNNSDTTTSPTQGYIPTSSYANLVAFSGGTAGSEPTLGQYQSGWDKFNEAEDVDIRICMHNGSEMLSDSARATLARYINTLCEYRKDCFGIIDCLDNDTHDSPQALVDWKRDSLNINSSYSSLYGPWQKVYDRYTDSYLFIPVSGIVGAVFVKNDHMAESWFAPAGFRRGMISVEEGAFNPNKGDRDLMYVNNINPIVTFKGMGTVVFGQKTLQTRPSPTDRVNVRRLLIEIEKATSTSAYNLLFEPNDAYTRLEAQTMFDRYLKDVQNRRGLEEFRVVCDENNNPGQIRQAGRLIIDIYVKPVFATEFIVINFNILRADASIEEYIALAA